MALTVTMPQLGESVTEGTIARWLKQPGDAIAKYELIAEVITDKVNAEIPAPADGVMSELIAPEGTVVPVGQPICSIDTADGAAAAPVAAAVAEPAVAAPAPMAESRAPASASPRRRHHRSPRRQPSPPSLRSRRRSPKAETEAPAAEVAVEGNGQAGGYHVTPAVRMLVREHDVDLSQITGSGIGGRITKKDVLEYVQRRDADAGARGLVPRALRLGCLLRRLPGLCRLHRHPSRLRLRWPTAAPAPASAASASFTGAGTGEGDSVVPSDAGSEGHCGAYGSEQADFAACLRHGRSGHVGGVADSGSGEGGV